MLICTFTPSPSGDELMTTLPFGRPASFGSVAMYCAPDGLSVTIGAEVDWERVVGKSTAKMPTARVKDRMLGEVVSRGRCR